MTYPIILPIGGGGDPAPLWFAVLMIALCGLITLPALDGLWGVRLLPKTRRGRRIFLALYVATASVLVALTL